MELDASIAKLKPALECELCSKNFPSFTLLQNHFLVDHPGGEFHVSCCQRKFIHRSRLEEHLRIHKDTLLPPSPQCPACGKKFELQKTLINHTRQCPRYKLKFGLKGRSNNKRKRVQVKKKTTVPSTTINNNSTKQVQIKNVPIPLAESKQNQIRNSTEAIECKQCGVCLENVAQLRIHNTKYHAVRNFKCSYCVKAFTRSDSLREHMATHTGTPLYSCPYCPRTFIYSSTKRKHLKDEHPNMQPTQDNIIVVPHKQQISNIKTINKQKSRR